MRTIRKNAARHNRTVQKLFQAIEMLEGRLMLAAHIAGDSTTYSTIQSAVNAASAGAVITVDAGTYAERVTISKPLTLLGAQAGVDGASRVGASAASESIVSGDASTGVHTCAFYVTASDVTIDGFTVQGQTDTSDTMGAGIVIAPKQSGTHIFNNIIQNNIAGLFLANFSNADAALIQHNYFANNNNSGGNNGRGIYTNGTLSGGNLTNVVIDSNTFVNNYGTDRVEAACAFQAGSAGEQSNIQITNNVMSGNGKATLFFNTTGVLISKNTITGCIDAGSGALRFEGNNHDVTIQYNTADNNTAPAVAIDAKGTSGDSSGFVVNYNNFYNNDTSTSQRVSLVYDPNTYTGTLDVRNNWWGSASGPSGDGPGAGDAVSAASLQVRTVEDWVLVSGGTELYSPWLSAAYNSTPTIPSAPTNLSAILASAGQVSLAWTDNAPGNETGFIIERSADGVNFTQIATTTQGVTRYVDSDNLAIGTTYSYRVAATNTLGNSGYSNVSSVTVTASVTAYISDLPWVSATIGYGTIGIDKSEGGHTLTLRGTTYAKGIGTHAVSQIVYNLNGQYTSFVSDVGVDDEENAKGIGSVDFKVIGDGVTLFDSGVVTNNSAIVHINVSVAGVKQLTLLATNGVAGSIDYDHADWAGARLISVAVTPSIPAAPSALVATASPTQVALSWTDNAVGNEAGFIIQRSSDGVNFAPIGTTTTGVTQFVDKNVVIGSTYYYQVAATNSLGTSPWLSSAGELIPAQPPVSKVTLVAMPTSTTAGTANSFTVTLLDVNGNVAAGYTGVVHFTSTDPKAVLPADYTFTAADAGKHTFSATLTTAGSRTITVADTAVPSLSVTSSAITVKAGAAVAMAATLPSSITSKTSVYFTIRMVDAYGNTATGYLGTLHFTTTSKGVHLPGDYRFTTADAGVHTFKISFDNKGSQTVVVNDKSNTSLRLSLIFPVN